MLWMCASRSAHPISATRSRRLAHKTHNRPEQRAAAPTDIVDPPAEKPELPVARPPSPRPASSPSGFCDSPHCGLRSDELQLMLRAPQACAHGGVSYGLSHRSALDERSEKENGAPLLLPICLPPNLLAPSLAKQVWRRTGPSASPSKPLPADPTSRPTAARRRVRLCIRAIAGGARGAQRSEHATREARSRRRAPPDGRAHA